MIPTKGLLCSAGPGAGVHPGLFWGCREGSPLPVGYLPAARVASAALTPSSLPTAAFLTQSVCLDDTTVKFEIWDTAGQERYHSLAPMYYRGAQAAIVVYDITNQVGSLPMLRGCRARGTLVKRPGSEGLRGSGGACGCGGLPGATSSWSSGGGLCRSGGPAKTPTLQRSGGTSLEFPPLLLGNICPGKDMGEGAAETSQPQHRDCPRRQQGRPGQQTHGGV